MLIASPAASQVVPGILGFLVVAAMGIALFFLLRSMNKQLRKVVPDPRWREEARNTQTQAQEEHQEQDVSQNGVAKT
jgi:hypothetical protein